MSSRSSIFSTNDSHIYEETNAPRYDGDKWLGYDIDLIIGLSELRTFTFKDNAYTVVVKGELQELMPDTIKISAADIVDIELDSEDLGITVKGGSDSAKAILRSKPVQI